MSLKRIWENSKIFKCAKLSVNFSPGFSQRGILFMWPMGIGLGEFLGKRWEVSSYIRRGKICAKFRPKNRLENLPTVKKKSDS